YFITASDAGALVIAMITSRGEEEPALWLRIFWAMTCGGVAAGLLLAGGLQGVQMAAVIAALPLAVVRLMICYGVWKALRDETALSATGRLPAAPVGDGGASSWRRRLGAIVSHPSKGQVAHYIETTVARAFDAVAAE